MKKTRIIFIAFILALLIPLNSFAQKSVSVRIGDIMVADRNIGTKVPQGGIALNYTNDTTHADHNNSLFKGDYYTWEEAQKSCPSAWRLPTKDELDVISKAMQFSDGKAYLKDGNGNRCYFHLSGRSNKPSCLNGYYWSSVECDNNAILLIVLTRASAVGSGNCYDKSDSLSVRCVKIVE